jgi:hypothetical protein
VNPLEEQIEVVVREVLARLKVAPAGAGLRQARSARIAGDESRGQLTLQEKVVSTEQLAGGFIGIGTVSVDAQAVVTPAAIDLLKSHQVTLVRRAASAAPPTGPVRLVVAAAACREPLAPLVQRLARDGVLVEPIAHSGLLGVIDEMTEEIVKGGKLGLLVTPEVAPAICLANRLRGVRAVHAIDLPAVDADVRSVGANLLVLSPSGHGAHAMYRMARAFCLHYPRTVAEPWRERLA